MTRERHFSKIIFTFLFNFIFLPLFAEQVFDPLLNYSFDIPEGYVVSDYTEDGLSILFEHSGMPVSFLIKVYSSKDYGTSDTALDVTLQKLSSKGEIDLFNWSEKKCALSYFEMNLDKKNTGWAVAAPVGNDEYQLVALCYCPSEYENKCNPFIISTINSLCINPDYFYTPGIITTYAYPSEGKKNIKLNIGNYEINSTIDSIDSEASQFIVDLEYNVLTLYANHPMKMEAWKRYYKMIFRDSYGRLTNVGNAIKKEIYDNACVINPENPELEYAATILSWIQNFDYKRDTASKNSSDFTCLPAVLEGIGNDCDSRSMLLCLLMKYIDVDSVMLFSQAYSHAMAAIDLNALGQKFTMENEDKTVEYIMGETTAKVTLGTIAQDHADRSKWEYVRF